MLQDGVDDGVVMSVLRLLVVLWMLLAAILVWFGRWSLFFVDFLKLC